MANVKSLVKALVAGSVSDAVSVLSTLNMEELKVSRNTFNAAYSEAKKLIEAAVLAADTLKAEREAELQTTIAKIQANIEGLDLEVVTKLATEQMNKKYGIVEDTAPKSKKWEQARVDVSVNGVVYNIPVNGNTTPVVREAIQAAIAAGQTREQWIEANKVAEQTDAE